MHSHIAVYTTIMLIQFLNFVSFIFTDVCILHTVSELLPVKYIALA